MLKEAMLGIRVTDMEYAPDIKRLLIAGKKDLEIAGVCLPGSVMFTVGTNEAVTDRSTLKDPLAMRAVITYAQMRFGNPPNYDKLADAYDLQKVQLMHANGYTDYGEGDGDAES